MLATLRKKLKWTSKQLSPGKTNCPKNSLILAVFMKLLEQVLFWKSMWLSASFVVSWHFIFMLCVYRQITLLQFVLSLSMTALIMDALECWLTHQHRTSCLKRIAEPEPTQLKETVDKLLKWMDRKWYDFVGVRETNHTKAFLLVNMILGVIYFFDKFMNSYIIVYLMCLFISTSYLIAPPVLKLKSHIFQDIESESELEGLIPEATEVNIKLLSIEPEKSSKNDDRQSLDYWKPEDVPIEEISDSSENSSSIITNFSIEKVQSLQRDVETSDSSEDEYIPIDEPKQTKQQPQQQKDQPKTTVEIKEPSATWSQSAYNAFWNITGAVANMVQTENKETNRRKRVSSVDSSDGFEMVDKNDLD